MNAARSYVTNFDHDIGAEAVLYAEGPVDRLRILLVDRDRKRLGRRALIGNRREEETARPGKAPPLARSRAGARKAPTLAQSIVEDSCGGNESKPRLSKSTSYAIPAPPRIEVLPLSPGEYAKPIRGPQLFVGAFGELKSIKPGTLASVLRFCSRFVYGIVVYS